MSLKGKSIIKSDNTYIGGIAAAGNVSAGDMILWHLLLLPPLICTCGAGIFWISIGMFAFHTFGWLLLSDRLKIFADLSGAARRTLPDYFRARYDSRRLRAFYSVILFAIFSVIIALLFDYIMDMTDSILPSYLRIYAAVAVGALIIAASFMKRQASSLLQNILLFLITLLIIFMCIYMFIKYTPGEVLKLYNKCRLEGGTSNYLNVLYIEGRQLSWTEILSMIGIGCGIAGLPYLYTNAASLKTNKDIDKARIQGIINSGILIVALYVMCLLTYPAIYPEKPADDIMFYAIIGKMAEGYIGSGFAADIIKYAAFVLILSVSMLLAAGLFRQMLIIIKTHIPKSDKKKNKNKFRFIFDIFIIICVLAVEILIICASDNISGLFKIAWGVLQSAVAAPFILSVLRYKTTEAGAFAGGISGLVSFFIWYFLPVSGNDALADITGIGAGFVGFVVSFIICVIVSIFTRCANERIMKILEKVRLERQ